MLRLRGRILQPWLVEMCNLPIEIADSEKVVRAIMSPYHFNNNGHLRPAAFRSEPGTDNVSVIRQTYMGSDFCKAKAKEIAAASPGKTYMGLAVLIASQIRDVGAKVIDSVGTPTSVTDCLRRRQMSLKPLKLMCCFYGIRAVC